MHRITISGWPTCPFETVANILRGFGFDRYKGTCEWHKSYYIPDRSDDYTSGYIEHEAECTWYLDFTGPNPTLSDWEYHEISHRLERIYGDAVKIKEGIEPCISYPD